MTEKDREDVKNFLFITVNIYQYIWGKNNSIGSLQLMNASLNILLDILTKNTLLYTDKKVFIHIHISILLK